MKRKRHFMNRLRNATTVVDPGTGEELEGVVMFIPRRKTNGFGNRWLAMAQDPGEILAHSNLVGVDFKVMFLLLNKLDFENHMLIHQVELAENLGMYRQNVARSIKRLIAVGVVLEGPKVKHNRTYKLNPEFGWKGSGDNHRKALADHRKARMKAAKISGIVKTPPPETNPEK